LTWDSKYFDTRRNKVLNKHARTNLCVGDIAQKANFEEKKGTIYNFKDVAALAHIRAAIPDFVGAKGKNLLAEGNCYGDGGETKTGIGYHGNSERRIVVGCRFGAGGKTPSLCYRWYQDSKVISKTKRIDLDAGDMYIMSQKAVGTDWRLRVDSLTKKPLRTLRHSTGAPKYTNTL